MTETRVYRTSTFFGLAFPQNFANWQTPTSAELNNTTNPGLMFNITCAADEANTHFNLGAGATDTSLSFCQAGGSTSLTFYNPDIVFQIFRSQDPVATNQANTAFGLLAFPDEEYFAIYRVGLDSSVAFATGQTVYMVRIHTDNPIDGISASDNETLQNTLLSQGDVLWAYTLAA